MITFPNKLLARGFAALLISLLVHLPIIEAREPANHPPHQPQSSGQPNFRVEIHSVTEHGPQIVLTNLSEEPLTACFLQVSFWKQDRKPSGMLWDAFIQNTPPIAKDADVSMPLGHVVGEPYPDKVEVAAAVWADGTTFGSSDQLKRIFSNRAYWAHSLDRTITLLQAGLQQEWTRDQYLAALDKAPDALSSQAFGVRSTMKVNTNLDANPSVRNKLVQNFIDSLSTERDALRKSKPDFDAPMNPT